MADVSKHTPGPWVWSGDQLLSSQKAKGYSTPVLVADWTPEPKDRALISAAPELLNVAQMLAGRLPLIADPDAVGEEDCAEIPITWREWSTLRAAIAKATGAPC